MVSSLGVAAPHANKLIGGRGLRRSYAKRPDTSLRAGAPFTGGDRLETMKSHW